MEQHGYTRNAGAVFSLKYHLVFCPKYRKSVLVGLVAERLKTLLTAKADELHVTLHTLEVMPDHVHMFVESDPGIALQSWRLNSRALRLVSCGRSFGICGRNCRRCGVAAITYSKTTPSSNNALQIRGKGAMCYNNNAGMPDSWSPTPLSRRCML